MKKLISWIRTDGLLHIETSALLVIAIATVLSLWLSCIITLILGIGKELLYDKKGKGVASWHDVTCDIIGLALGVLIVLLS